ncbi:hypothetical protein [Sphingomonas taxi]|uniref:hypothetical protein n=1 Tax=Sphingomonas taxi TaxID=1549858 RepID=UPI001FDEB324|nr:hypothetical protein [Sphingomonas taxi]
MSTGLSRRGRTALAVLVALALSVPAAAIAPQPGARKTAPRAKAAAKAKTKAKTAKPVAPVVVPALPRSDAANRVIAWVAAAHDNAGLPYAVIDKPTASLFLFSAKGEFLGETPVLLGVGVGDESSPGIGAKRLEEIGPVERTTPAGRFVAKFGRAFGNQRVLWVDYANSVALHAVITTHKSEHRVDRLLSPTPDDNRISFGCINVGTSFYIKSLRPLFQKKGGIVYILPDTLPLDDVFPRLRLLPYLGADGRMVESVS